MKNIIILLVFLFSILNVNAAYRTASQTLYKQNIESPTPTAIISSAQDLTVSWAALGSQQTSGGFSSAGLYLDVDINDSENVRIRALVRHTTGGATFLLPIKTVASNNVKVEPEYIEFNVDSDQKMLISWDLDRVIPFIEFQVQVSAVNTTAAQIDSANLILRWK